MDTWPWPRRPPDQRELASFADAAPIPYWLDRSERPAPAPPLEGEASADLAVVGGGLAGLWAALIAKERDPSRDVALLEADRIAGAASGRNGGFFISSLTHGIGNGAARYPDEIATLERLGLESFEAAAQAFERHGIECGFERHGDVEVALEPHEVEWLAEEADLLRRHGHDVTLLDRDEVRGELDSPLYHGGRWQRSGAALVDPAQLAWGLADAARSAGVRVFEGTPARRLRPAGSGHLDLALPGARLRARRALLATGAFPGLVRASRRRVVPVWDYVLVTERLTAEQRAAIGWRNRQGFGDSANQFHYYRLTADDRILWGGYDAIYRYGNGLAADLAQRDASFAVLAQHFFATFPQLEGIRFSHRWGGAIDTCSRFFAFAGTALSGRVAYTVGHTGLGVCASRFGAELALDLLDGADTEATRLRSMRERPLPFPPEPLRWAAIQLTRNRLAAADRRGGRRGLWLRALDRAGLGFDS